MSKAKDLLQKTIKGDKTVKELFDALTPEDQIEFLQELQKKKETPSSQTPTPARAYVGQPDDNGY